MKEVKEFRKSYIFLSALYVVLGVVLMAWPSASVRMICYGLGIAMLVLGIILTGRPNGSEGFSGRVSLF